MAKRPTVLGMPELALVAGTRAVLGAGLGVLLGQKLSERKRKAVGWTLVAVGALSTIPLGIDVLSRRQNDAVADKE